MSRLYSLWLESRLCTLPELHHLDRPLRHHSALTSVTAGIPWSRSMKNRGATLLGSMARGASRRSRYPPERTQRAAQTQEKQSSEDGPCDDQIFIEERCEARSSGNREQQRQMTGAGKNRQSATK